MNRPMGSDTHSELMRLLQGELDEDRARRLQRQLESDGELRAAFDRLQATWQALDLPPSEPAPPGYATRVTAEAFSADAGPVPPWFRDTLLGRAATAAALVGGVLLGALVASPQQIAAEGTDFWSAEPTMAESYWEIVDDPDQALWDEGL